MGAYGTVRCEMWSGFIIRQSWTNDLLGIECENFYCLVKLVVILLHYCCWRFRPRDTHGITKQIH